MKRVLITGADSYIGMSFESYAKEHYGEEFEIDTVDMRDDRWRKEDFSVYDTVFHVAGLAHADVGNVSEEVKKKYYAINKDLAIETAEKAKIEGVKQFVLMSSMIVYGESAPYGKQKIITADTEPKPANFYGDSKWQADIGVRKLTTGDFKVAVLRPPMIYGKGSKGNYPILAKLAKKLPVFPNVDNKRSMLHIDNLSEFLCQLMLLELGGIFFPQNEEYTRTSEMVEAIAGVYGKKIVLTKVLNLAVWLCSKIPGKIGGLVNKAFGNSCYEQKLSEYGFEYRRYGLKESIVKTEALKDSEQNIKARALMFASVASMIDLFNKDNINILLEKGYSVDVAANFQSGSITSQERVDAYKKELKESGIDAYDICVPRSLFQIKDIWNAYKITKKLVENKQYEIVHCHSPIGGVICRLACRKARKNGTKVIYTAHGFHFFKGAPLINWLLYYPVEKFLSRWTDMLITINQEDYQRAKKSFHTKRIEYVPGIGIDLKRFKRGTVNRNEKRKLLGLQESDKMLLSVGELSVRKNHSVVIKALAKLKNPNIKYFICGQGKLKDELEDLIQELKLQKQVILLGYRSDISELCQCTDLYVFPSLQEGLPVALMEAMACGLPVVCSSIRGNVDLIDEINHEQNGGGMLFSPGDIEACKNAIEILMKSDLYNVGNYNLEKIQEFQIDKVSEIMKKLYELM